MKWNDFKFRRIIIYFCIVCARARVFVYPCVCLPAWQPSSLPVIISLSGFFLIAIFSLIFIYFFVVKSYFQSKLINTQRQRKKTREIPKYHIVCKYNVMKFLRKKRKGRRRRRRSVTLPYTHKTNCASIFGIAQPNVCCCCCCRLRICLDFIKKFWYFFLEKY